MKEQHGIVLLLHLVLIRDREKQQTTKEAEAVQIRFQSLRDTIALEQTEYNNIITRDLISFANIIIRSTPLS